MGERGRQQTPVLFGTGEDFALIQFDEAPAAPSETAAVTYPDWLRDGWKLRDKWRMELAGLGPGILRDLEAVLLCAELRWRGGIEEARLKSDWQNDKQRLLDQAQRIMDSRPTLLPRSLPLALDSKKNTATLADTVRLLLPRAYDPDAKIDDKNAAAKAKKEEFDKEVKGLQAVLNKQPLEAAQALVEAATGNAKLGPAQLVLIGQLLHNLPPTERHAQTVFLERLLAFETLVRNNGWDWPLAEVQQALKTMRASESLLAEVAEDPALLPWLAEPWKKADDRRRRGDKRLLGGLLEPDSWTKANQELKEADAQYAELQLRAQGLERARKLYDRAYALLPNLSPHPSRPAGRQHQPGQDLVGRDQGRCTPGGPAGQARRPGRDAGGRQRSLSEPGGP